jgi:hypothetical protein
MTQLITYTLLAMLLQFSLPAMAQQSSDQRNTPSAAAIAQVEDHDFPDFSEDLQRVSLDTSTLNLKSTLSGRPAATSTYTLEVAQVKWRPSDSIDLYIALPRGVKRPPVVIYLYGHPIYPKRYSDEGWYNRVTSGGFAAVAFLPALSGSRLHSPRPMNQDFLNHLPETLPLTAHDLQMVLNYLKTRSDLDLDLDHVGVFATSFGATAAILAASVDPRIKVLDLLNPWGDWPDWASASELVSIMNCSVCSTPEFTSNLAPFDPVKWLPTLKTPAIRVRQFPGNGEIPKAAQDKIEAVLPPTAGLLQFESVAEFNRSASGGATFDWIKDVLKPKPTQPAQSPPKPTESPDGT